MNLFRPSWSLRKYLKACIVPLSKQRHILLSIHKTKSIVLDVKWKTSSNFSGIYWRLGQVRDLSKLILERWTYLHRSAYNKDKSSEGSENSSKIFLRFPLPIVIASVSYLSSSRSNSSRSIGAFEPYCSSNSEGLTQAVAPTTFISNNHRSERAAE